MNEERKCQYILADGSKCQAWSLTNKQFCFSHDPQSREAKLLAVTKGGLAKEIEINSPLQKIEINVPRDVVTLLAQTVGEVRSGALDPKIGTAIGYLSGVLLKAFEVSHSADGGWQTSDKDEPQSWMDAPRKAAEALQLMAEEDRLAILKIVDKYAKPPAED